MTNVKGRFKLRAVEVTGGYNRTASQKQAVIKGKSSQVPLLPVALLADDDEEGADDKTRWASRAHSS